MLWDALRELPTAGTHFRRQVPIGPYVVDIACMGAKLVIEVDGSHHGEEKHIQKDADRTRWLESEGYRVLRFWNSDVTGNKNAVLDAMYAAVYGSSDALHRPLKHERKRQSGTSATPPRARRASRADRDPPPPGEGGR